MPSKTVRKNVRKKELITPPVEQEPIPVISSNKFAGIKKKYIIIAAVIIIIFGMFYYLRSYFVVATVNGQPISRSMFDHELQKQEGKQVLSTLVRKTIVMQAADKNHITVSQNEVNNQIKKIENSLAKKGQKLDQALLLSGLTRTDLEDQVKTQLILEKLFAKNIRVSDKEIDDYIAKNTNQNGQIPGSDIQQPQLSRDDAREAIKQDKLTTVFKPWLDQQQGQAKIVYFINLP